MYGYRYGNILLVFWCLNHLLNPQIFSNMPAHKNPYLKIRVNLHEFYQENFWMGGSRDKDAGLSS